MQVINITCDEKGMMNVASPFDVPTTLIALLEAQKLVLVQNVIIPSLPKPETGVVDGEDPNKVTTETASE